MSECFDNTNVCVPVKVLEIFLSVELDLQIVVSHRVGIRFSVKKQQVL